MKLFPSVILIIILIIILLSGALTVSQAFPANDELSITKHQVRIGGQTISYTATTGTMRMEDEEGNHKADIFFIAYTRDGVNDMTKRPVTFSFNGGPGSSSVWLHLGALGPKRVVMSEKGEMLRPPFELTDNEYSWLDETDLVFIDPVMTGYSRPAPGEDKSQFHGYVEDIESVGEFIRLYTTRYERWASPKFLAGESYGTTRAAGLSAWLQDRHGMYINGLMLISSIMNFQTARFDPGNNLPYILFLPTYTATAWYHNRLSPDLQQNLWKTLHEVENFALTDYAQALMRGDQLSETERRRIVNQLSHYTGLSTEYVENANLRIHIRRFTKELMRQEGRTVGRLDSRFKGIDADNAGEFFEYDPSYNGAIYGPYAATLNHYVRSVLKYENDLPYEILTGRVRPWSYSNVENRYLNVAEDLRSAMSRNPYLKVWIANGYYDLATPYFATEYTVNQMGLDPAVRGNINLTYYESGHMMYIHMPSLKQFRQDFITFMRRALAG
ncbi:MAG: peptidase S10 [Balneolaceae bacterium]|nr:MAG: peptidase S10 [Balneolaceae bacterium]